MKDLLKYLITQLLGNTEFSIKENEEDNALIYTILLKDADYPVIIGKRGMTIKALTALCRVKERAEHPLNGERFYIKVDSEGLKD